MERQFSGQSSGQPSGLGWIGKLLVLATGGALLAATALALYLFSGEKNGPTVDLVIARGTSLQGVVRLLSKEQVIERPNVFRYLLRATQGSQYVRAGEFRFNRNMRPLDAIRILYFAKPIVHQVTIPEGWNIAQIAEILEGAGLANRNRFIALAKSEKTAIRYRYKTPSLEGFLFPDTYAFSKIDSEEKILEIMVKRFREKIDPYVKEAKLKGFNIERWVTLASIIEKETGAEAERPVIASVFLNRLKRKMRLQSDPTTIYGIKNFNGNLTKKDLLTYTPYNTYRIKGLPPGPIANPGEASLLSVLRPSNTDYLYFVSNNNGTHIFSKTYKEHAHHVNVLQRGWGRKRRPAKED